MQAIYSAIVYSKEGNILFFHIDMRKEMFSFDKEDDVH
jgi:hypothetical protein